MSSFIEKFKAELLYRIEFYKMIKTFKAINEKEEWLEATNERRYLTQSRVLTRALLDRILKFAEKYEKTKLLTNKKSDFEWAKNELDKFTDKEKWKTQNYYEAFILIKRMLDCFKSKPILWLLSIEEFLITSGVFAAVIVIVQIVEAR